jgi:hypothetical protein
MIHEWDVPSIPFKMKLKALSLWEKNIAGVFSSLVFMFQWSNHVSIPLRPRCSFLRTNPYLRSVACIQVSSAKRPRQTPEGQGVSFTYIRCNVRDRTEPCGVLACMSLSIDVSPSTETLNFLYGIKEIIRLITLTETFTLDNLYSKPMCNIVSKTLQYPRIMQL